MVGSVSSSLSFSHSAFYFFFLFSSFPLKRETITVYILHEMCGNYKLQIQFIPLLENYEVGFCGRGVEERRTGGKGRKREEKGEVRTIM